MNFPTELPDDWDEIGGLIGARLFEHNAKWNPKPIEGGIEATVARIKIGEGDE